jgi:hypothetical protein
VGEQAEVLEDHREPPAAELAEALRGCFANVLAVEVDGSERRLDEASQAPDERRLAAARQAHDDEDLAGLDLERDVVDGDRPTVLLDGRFDLVSRRSGSAGAAAQARLGRPEDLPQAADRDRGPACSPGCRGGAGS